MYKETPQQFSSKDEELAYLRARITDSEARISNERALGEAPPSYEAVAQQELKDYQETKPEAVLSGTHRMQGHELNALQEHVETAHNQVDEIITIARTKGIKNALTLLDKADDPYLTDEVHRLLIQDIKAGRPLASVKEGSPMWEVLHMTLFEVALPEANLEAEGDQHMREFISFMEQFFAGMDSINRGGKKKAHYAIEVAVSDKTEDIVFYVAVPTKHIDLFEKQLLSLFPKALITEQQNDYNIFVEGAEAVVAVGELKKHPIYPIRTYDTFERDPLNVLLNAFSKIERDGSGAALQIIIEPGKNKYYGVFESIAKRVRKGTSVGESISQSTFWGQVFAVIKDIVSPKKKDDMPSDPDQSALESFDTKLKTSITGVNVRIAVSSKQEEKAAQILSEIESTFNQFVNPRGNALEFIVLKGGKREQALEDFSFRRYQKKHALPLSVAELASIIHFPARGIDSSPAFKQTRAKSAAAPLDLPQEGTLLGVNEFRNTKKDIYVTEEDRLRHFYIIGQTGTGKTTLMKNMITQDIQAGHGVCMIDPHGTDIADVLASVPPEREDDVIYFDPSYMERVMGLNMLEYDTSHPEQKTFVVNELFSIFQKLYGSVPESMGPMFEQYFRNATLLVLEDPESGSTLLDISRVMADAEFRKSKLEKARNPVVTQFWGEIATKAGGEAALENIVPYITSKFDVFTANDFMRPIIGQQESSFNFREIMDEKKILLVNLSKGRLGEINANLIGMIIVGKILMAALSRVDDVSKSFPPFYLHMDEFQNVTTDSISAILSEARKYKLGLTIAHQFIAQLDEKISDAVFGNVGSLAAFRVGPEDSEFLARQFEPVFEASDLINIENRHAYVRILSNGTPAKPFDIATMAPPESDPSKINRLIEKSYETYGIHRRKVEMQIAARYRV